VAHAVWQYWRATADDDFLFAAGAEIILETARFWASRATLEADGLYHVRGVVGPDEYHEPVDDSAFTNGMARANLRLGAEVAAWFEHSDPDRWRGLCARLTLSQYELQRWTDIADRLANVQFEGLIEEFPGYLALDDLDLQAFEPRSAALPALIGRERVQRTQVIKQADVILLCHLFRDQMDAASIARNFEYYEPRCDHGSSLSPSIYALVAARLGLLERARHHLDHASAVDLDDRMGNSAQGIHLGACGGLWQAIVFGAAGMQLVDGGLRFEPHLLGEWKSLTFAVMHRGSRLEVSLRPAPEPCEFNVTGGDGLWIELAGRGRDFVRPGERRLVR
jgi:kojibiose phosphorylase